MLWLTRFASVEELHAALQEFADRFNNLWILGRLGYKTPAQHRRSFLVEGGVIYSNSCVNKGILYIAAQMTSRLPDVPEPNSFDAFLTNLHSLANAASIMTPWDKVKSVEAIKVNRTIRTQAKRLMHSHHFSAVPLVWKNELTGVFIRNRPTHGPRYERVNENHFEPPKIGLIPLIRDMGATKRFVVAIGTATSPVGWLTYADFSKRPFRVLIFSIISEVEYLLAAAINRIYPKDEWIKLFTPGADFRVKSIDELRKRQHAAQHWDVTMPLTTFAEIGHLAAVAGMSTDVRKLLGESENLNDQLKSFSELRNRVAHVVRSVVAGPSGISGVANQIDLMLGWTDRWSSKLA